MQQVRSHLLMAAGAIALMQVFLMIPQAPQVGTKEWAFRNDPARYLEGAGLTCDHGSPEPMAVDVFIQSWGPYVEQMMQAPRPLAHGKGDTGTP
eukprot:9331296-Karenia_brevis.AAC.1